jgi:hypothetical protein
MNTIASRLTLATTSAARQLGHHHVLAATAAAVAGHGAGLGVMTFLVLAGLLIAALSAAARSLATVLAELVRLAAAVTSVMFTFAIAIIIGVVLLAAH